MQGEQATPNGSAGAPREPGPGAAPDPGAESRCGKCLAPMAAGQDWCLQCGAGAPGSLGTPSWRSLASVIAAVAVLVLGAAAAGYAALNKGAKTSVVTKTVAATVPTATTPAPTATTPAVPGGAAATPKAQGLPGLGAGKPPKIPLTAATPRASSPSGTGTGAAETTTPTTTTPSTSTTPAGATPGKSGTTAKEESQPAAILLDTNAASTYNPYNLPAADFGDPSLAIDGDPTTAWTAQVDPASAPTMAEGLLIDLKSKQKVSALKLITSTPGMTVEVYGTKGATAPTSITDPGWTPLSHLEVVKKKHARLTLRDSKKAFTYLTLWISKAPESSIGTPEAPGHVSVEEVELIPTG
jgi:hypothetical protein